MKKLLLFILLTATVSAVHAQSQLSTIRGKTKDGKTIKVEYYQGSVEDYVESVKYQLVDELQAQAKELQKNIEGTKKELEKTKKDLDQSNKNLDKSNKTIDKLNGTVKLQEGTIKTLRMRIDSLVAINRAVTQGNTGIITISSNDEEVKKLRDSILSKDTEIQSLQSSIETLNKEVSDLNKEVIALRSKPVGKVNIPHSPVIGVAFGLGPVFARDEMQDEWAKDVKWCKSVEVYFGTASFSNSFPVSLEAGVGIRSFALLAHRSPYHVTLSQIDNDGDAFDAIYDYSAMTESLSLTYLDIPVRICFGVPNKYHTSVYAKLGLTPSIKMSSNFQGQGTYSLKGYYPQWDVTLENITELGFGADMDCYNHLEPELNGFILWGNVALGAYVPFQGTNILLNGGVKLDIPFMGIGTAKEGMGLLSQGGKVLIPSIELGIIYSLK